MKDKKNNLLKTSLIVTIISVLAKFIGFARDAVIAAFYGANWKTDAFFFAQSMPGIVFPAVCNSLSTAFLTMYVTKSVEDKTEADVYGSKAVTFSVFFAIVLSIVAILLTPIIVPFLAPGFSLEQIELAKYLSRITMAAFVLIMIQYMLGAILSAKKLFYGAQIAGLFYNASVIIITIILGKNQDMDVLTYTVVIGHIIQVIALCFIVRKNFKYSFRLRLNNEEMKSLVRLTLPIILGNSIVQINNIVDKVLSSLLGDGAMSALSYSNTLNRFITGVVITTLSTVVYPILVEKFSKNELKDFCSGIINSISIGLIVLIPISIITTMCASDIVKIVYERGSFDETATKLTSLALMFYGMMFVFAVVQEVVTRAFYSMKDTKTPLKAAAIAIINNAIISYVFSRIMGMGLGGIALGTTLSTFFASVLLLIALRKRIPELRLTKLKDTAVKLLISSIVLIIAIMVMNNLFLGVRLIIRFSLITVITFIIHIGVLVLLKCDDLRIIKDYVKRY